MIIKFLKNKKLKSFCFLGFCFLNTIILAQIENDCSKNFSPYKWSISASINNVESQVGDPEKACWGYAYLNMFQNFNDKSNKSLSFSLTPKYYINNKDFLFRLELGVTNINWSSYSNSHDSNIATTSYTMIRANIKQTIYRVCPGVQINLLKTKYLDFYMGATANYLNYEGMEYIARFETKEFPTNKFVSASDDKAKGRGGFATGLGSLIGFNLYIQKHVSIGTEFSTSLMYYKIGGDWAGQAIHYNATNSQTTYNYNYSNSSYKGVQFSKIHSLFHFSLWF